MIKWKNCSLNLLWKKELDIEIESENSSRLLPENNELYRYWRGVQREQLGLSANIYMIFGSAILGFLVNFLVTNKCTIGLFIKIALFIGALLVFCSLFIYSKFTKNRLNDFRNTARLLNSGKNEEEVRKETELLGKRTWELYICQICFLTFGFLISFFGLSIYIFKT